MRIKWQMSALLIVPALAACGGGEPTEQPTQPAAAVVQPTVAAAPTDAPAAPEAAEAEVIIGDVLDYSLDPMADWPEAAKFGWVEFTLHEGRAGGEPVYFIRTDASDEAFATQNGLVHVPLLANALRDETTTSTLYMMGPDDMPVLSSTPADEMFSSAFKVVQVTPTGDAVEDLESAEAILDAETAGTVTVEDTGMVVNYPVVSWSGGEMSVDEKKDSYLGTGQLIELDKDGGTVTFKLHECFSGARYIVTDTSAVPMAPMMSISPAGAIGGLVAAEAVDKIYVFGNGIEGSGVMGFQPAIFRNKAGTAAWSPFWDHFTVVWADDAEPRILTTEAEILAAETAGEVTIYNGTPDTHPMGFVVNCPVPVLAPNTFEAP